jgi:hypothetical protein
MKTQIVNPWQNKTKNFHISGKKIHLSSKYSACAYDMPDAGQALRTHWYIAQLLSEA